MIQNIMGEKIQRQFYRIFSEKLSFIYATYVIPNISWSITYT